jgi:hypothetical protein
MNAYSPRPRGGGIEPPARRFRWCGPALWRLCKLPVSDFVGDLSVLCARNRSMDHARLPSCSWPDPPSGGWLCTARPPGSTFFLCRGYWRLIGGVAACSERVQRRGSWGPPYGAPYDAPPEGAPPVAGIPHHDADPWPSANPDNAQFFLRRGAVMLMPPRARSRSALELGPCAETTRRVKGKLALYLRALAAERNPDRGNYHDTGAAHVSQRQHRGEHPRTLPARTLAASAKVVVTLGAWLALTNMDPYRSPPRWLPGTVAVGSFAIGNAMLAEWRVAAGVSAGWGAPDSLSVPLSGSGDFI